MQFSPIKIRVAQKAIDGIQTHAKVFSPWPLKQSIKIRNTEEHTNKTQYENTKHVNPVSFDEISFLEIADHWKRIHLSIKTKVSRYFKNTNAHCCCKLF